MSFFFEENDTPAEKPGTISYRASKPISVGEALQHIETKEKVLELGSSDEYWVELLGDMDARAATLLSGTAIGHFFEIEHAEENGHPRRWFALVSSSGDRVYMPVVLCVTPPGVQLVNPNLVNEVHTTGYQNRNPYPEFEVQIEQLSEKIGIDLPANYMGQRLDVSRGPGR